MRTFSLLLILLATACVGTHALAQQAGTKPITENGLLQALKIGGLTQAELVDQVNARSVDFTLSPSVEEELRKAGAGADLLDAVRSHQPAQSTPSQAMAVVEHSDSPAGAPDPPSGQQPLTLRSVHKLYLERMPNGLDQFLREAIFKKCGSFFTIVLNRKDADAIMKVTDPRLPGTVSMTDPGGTLVLWSGSADSKETKYLNLRHGGEKVLAEKLAGQLKHAIGQ